MTDRISDTTLAYVAGIIDTIAIIRTRVAFGTEIPHVQINGRYYEQTAFLEKVTPTRTIQTTRDFVRAGCTEHCREKHEHVVSRSGRWVITGIKACVVLNAIHPYLRVKRLEADRAIRAGLAMNFKGAHVEQMVKLGWPPLPPLDAD